MIEKTNPTSLILSVFALAFSIYSAYHSHGSSAASMHQEIRATRIMLVDTTGKPRALFGFDNDDARQPVLRFYDLNGSGGVQLGISSDGNPLLALGKKDGGIKLMSSCDGAGHTIAFWDQARPRLTITHAQATDSAIMFFDKTGRCVQFTSPYDQK